MANWQEMTSTLVSRTIASFVLLAVLLFGGPAMSRVSKGPEPCPPYGAAGGSADRVIEGRVTALDGTTLQFEDGTTLHFQGVFSPRLESKCIDSHDQVVYCGRLSLNALNQELERLNWRVRCLVDIDMPGLSDKQRQKYGFCGAPQADSFCIESDLGVLLAKTGWAMLYDFTSLDGWPEKYAVAWNAVKDKKGLFAYTLLLPFDEYAIRQADWATFHEIPERELRHAYGLAP